MNELQSIGPHHRWLVSPAAGLAAGAPICDAELARSAGRGDPRAAVAIFARYRAFVRSVLRRWAGDQDLDDMVQEVFLRLFRRLPYLRQPDALRSFLFGISARVACTELRRRRTSGLRLTRTGDLPEIVERPRDDGVAREVLWRFEAILARLAPTMRSAFVLRYIDRSELLDVARALGISLSTAKRHLARASARVFTMAERDPALAPYVNALRAAPERMPAPTRKPAP